MMNVVVNKLNPNSSLHFTRISPTLLVRSSVRYTKLFTKLMGFIFYPPNLNKQHQKVVLYKKIHLKSVN